MADETTDALNREKVVIVLRYVDDSDFSVYEEFIGLYSVSSNDSDTPVSIVKDTLVRLNLPLFKVTGQCYDGANNMSAIKNGVATQIAMQRRATNSIYPLLWSLYKSSCRRCNKEK